MRKPIWALLMICFTLLCTSAMIWKPSETPVEARIVTVQRGDVHQVTAITGRIGYADEMIAYAGVSGIVSQLCVEPGQRVGAGEALVRFDMEQQAQIAAAYAENKAQLPDEIGGQWLEQQLSGVSNMVVRADSPATVRQLLVEEGVPVAAGTPVVRLSSSQQEIICSVASVDAEQIRPGMWAWLSSKGESLCQAEVIHVGETTLDPLTGLEWATVTLQPEQHIDLPEGAAVDADVYLAGSDDALTLPLEAITERETVWWVNEGRCTEIPAEIVMADEILAWVSLPEGIQVAVGEFEEGQYVREAAK